jgi:hypothetical protein
MLSQVFYLIRSKADGQYLVARTQAESKQRTDRTGGADTVDEQVDAQAVDAQYLLVFKEHYDALSYINTHGADVANRFAVESIAGTQLGNLLKRWGFMGMGMVEDPLLPRIEFLKHE